MESPTCRVDSHVRGFGCVPRRSNKPGKFLTEPVLSYSVVDDCRRCVIQTLSRIQESAAELDVFTANLTTGTRAHVRAESPYFSNMLLRKAMLVP